MFKCIDATVHWAEERFGTPLPKDNRTLSPLRNFRKTSRTSRAHNSQMNRTIFSGDFLRQRLESNGRPAGDGPSPSSGPNETGHRLPADL